MGKISPEKRRSVIAQKKKKKEKLEKLKKKYLASKKQADKRRIKEKMEKLLPDISAENYLKQS